jgi:DNA-binding Xre family transcriptional regulator/isopentenyldiphosphate isomerase
LERFNGIVKKVRLETGEIIMAVSYNKLWKLLVDKKMSKSDLRKKAEIAPNTMTKLRRDEEVSLTILSKICKTLNADFGDIVEYVPDAEIWDLYDENRELLGKNHVRGEQLPIDGYHLVVHVWIRNSKGEYLIAQRSANRPTFPLVWECVDGSVIKGEDSLQGALREVKEEVGVDLLPEKGHVILSDIKKIEFGKVVNKIVDVWLFEYDGEVDLSNATTDEVAQVAWMGRSQIKELFDANMFVDTLEYFFMEVDKERR